MKTIRRIWIWMALTSMVMTGCGEKNDLGSLPIGLASSRVEPSVMGQVEVWEIQWHPKDKGRPQVARWDREKIPFTVSPGDRIVVQGFDHSGQLLVEGEGIVPERGELEIPLIAVPMQ